MSERVRDERDRAAHERDWRSPRWKAIRRSNRSFIVFVQVSPIARNSAIYISREHESSREIIRRAIWQGAADARFSVAKGENCGIIPTECPVIVKLGWGEGGGKPAGTRYSRVIARVNFARGPLVFTSRCLRRAANERERERAIDTR